MMHEPHLTCFSTKCLSDKRNKRPRQASPAVTPTPAATQPKPGRITLPARTSAGPGIVAFSRDPKSRREALGGQLPLQRGRKVAFHQKPNVPGEDGEANWILAVIIQSINGDKNR